MIAALWLRLKGWVIAAGAVLAAIFFAWRRGRNDAREDARVQQEAGRAQRNAEAAQEMRQAAEDRNHVENDIARDGDARERLRDDWTRRD